jgi:hypothetical protein
MLDVCCQQIRGEVTFSIQRGRLANLASCIWETGQQVSQADWDWVQNPTVDIVFSGFFFV